MMLIFFCSIQILSLGGSPTFSISIGIIEEPLSLKYVLMQKNESSFSKQKAGKSSRVLFVLAVRYQRKCMFEQPVSNNYLSRFIQFISVMDPPLTNLQH